MSEKTEATAEPELLVQARSILQTNDRGNYTAPSPDLYPHQWLWDSCFIAIGLRWLDPGRAQTELTSLLRGQWSNGMMPNMIFNADRHYARDRNMWSSWLNPHSPDHIATSGITQPPMLAEAVWQVGQRLSKPERHTFYKKMLPHMVGFHEWLYAERDPHDEGLTIQIHPWETGLDSTPPWLHELHEHHLPMWIRAIQATHTESLVNVFRRDLHHVPRAQRFDTLAVLALFDSQRRLRRKRYDTERILNTALFAVEDLTYNCILIRANARLREIAQEIRYELPHELLASMQKSETALDALWDEYAGQYFSREFVTHKLLKYPTIATLMPLYTGTIAKERAAKLVKLLESETKFGSAYPVPSVPLDSHDFEPERYWQGPAWMNTNWLIADGLERYGYKDHAALLRETSLEMVQKGGLAEYFNPLSGAPLGAENFSWTAALAIDFLKHT